MHDAVPERPGPPQVRGTDPIKTAACAGSGSPAARRAGRQEAEVQTGDRGVAAGTAGRGGPLLMPGTGAQKVVVNDGSHEVHGYAVGVNGALVEVVWAVASGRQRRRSFPGEAVSCPPAPGPGRESRSPKKASGSPPAPAASLRQGQRGASRTVRGGRPLPATQRRPLPRGTPPPQTRMRRSKHEEPAKQTEGAKPLRMANTPQPGIAPRAAPADTA